MSPAPVAGEQLGACFSCAAHGRRAADLPARVTTSARPRTFKIGSALQYVHRMRTLSAGAILLLAVAPFAQAAEAPKEPQRASVVVLLPVADAKAPAGLALAMQEKATALLLGTNRYDVVNARQVRSMALRHRVAL